MEMLLDPSILTSERPCYVSSSCYITFDWMKTRINDKESMSPQVQRGFRSVLVYLTALDCTSDFLAVGSSIGMLYLYCRRLAHMNKYSLEVRALLLWCSFQDQHRILNCNLYLFKVSRLD